MPRVNPKCQIPLNLRKKRDYELKEIKQQMKMCPICDKDQLDDKKDKNRWISCFRCVAMRVLLINSNEQVQQFIIV